ncbi:MAG: IclR family transcriptional regulator, partial [Rhodospirillales bacterium]|nr:IclR family transcriptional regulator [Rhodospirillales bacterium]
RAFGGGDDELGRETRRAGFYISVGERNPDVSAVAAPVLGPSKELRGALAVSGLTTRFDAKRRQAARAVLEAAATRLSGRLV